MLLHDNDWHHWFLHCGKLLQNLCNLPFRFLPLPLQVHKRKFIIFPILTAVCSEQAPMVIGKFVLVNLWHPSWRVRSIELPEMKDTKEDQGNAYHCQQEHTLWGQSPWHHESPPLHAGPVSVSPMLKSQKQGRVCLHAFSPSQLSTALTRTHRRVRIHTNNFLSPNQLTYCSSCKTGCLWTDISDDLTRKVSDPETFSYNMLMC